MNKHLPFEYLIVLKMSCAVVALLRNFERFMRKFLLYFFEKKKNVEMSSKVLPEFGESRSLEGLLPAFVVSVDIRTDSSVFSRRDRQLTVRVWIWDHWASMKM